MVLRPRSSDAVAPTSDAATFYRLAGDGNMDAIEVLAQRVRWSQGVQPAASQSNASQIPADGSQSAPVTFADLLDFRCPKSGLTPLMAAVVRGHFAMTRQLLEYGAAVDAVDPAKGRTALHRAVKGSVMMYPMDVKIITLLVDSGANPFSADKKGFTAVDYLFIRRMSMSTHVPNSFELIVRSFLQGAVHAGAFDVKLSRVMGLARGWKKLYCALVPFSREVGADSTELQLLFIDTQSFTLVDRIWVTGSQSEPFMCRDRLQVEMMVRRQERTMEVFLTDAGNAKMKLQLRALSDSPADSNKLTKMIELATIDPADAAELPARRRAGLSFRASVVPSQPVSGAPNLNRSSASSVERSADSPRDMHMHSGRALDLHRFSMPAQRRASSRSRSRPRGSRGSSNNLEGQMEAALAGVAEAPAGVGEALAAAREDHRNSSRRHLVLRSDSARMSALEALPEVV